MKIMLRQLTPYYYREWRFSRSFVWHRSVAYSINKMDSFGRSYKDIHIECSDVFAHSWSVNWFARSKMYVPFDLSQARTDIITGSSSLDEITKMIIKKRDRIS